MSQLKYYNVANAAWEVAIVGAQGATGPAGEIGNTLTSNLDANGYNISNGNVITANSFVGTATQVNVEAVTNNYSYHVVLTTDPGDTTLHIDGSDNLQYNPADGILTTVRVDTEFLSVTNSVLSNLVPFDSLPLSLGNATNPWTDLYLSNSTLYIGDATISANGNSIVVDSITVSGSNVGLVGNIASINLDGNVSNVLAGDGTWVAQGGGGNANTGNITFNGDEIASTNDIVNILGNNYAQLQSNNTYMWVEDGNASIEVNGNQWTFDNNGNIILPGGGIVANPPDSSLDPLTPTASTMVITPDQNYINQSLVLDPTAPGHIHLRAVSGNIDQPYANIFLGGETSSFEVGAYYGTEPSLYIHSNNNTWTFDNTGNLTQPGNMAFTNSAAITSPGLEIYTNSGSGGSIDIYTDWSGNSNGPGLDLWLVHGDGIYLKTHDAAYVWKFDDSGNLTLPGNTFSVNYANGTQVPLGGGGSTGNITFNGDDIASTNDIVNILGNNYAELQSNATYMWVEDGLAAIQVNGNTWSFNTNSTITFPTTSVDLHNGGIQSAQTLQFGDPNQQVVITGPTPDVDNNAQRLIIQGQRGNGTGEGGDVYLWAGDADTNGGDIKIYAGDADGAGYGGYINIDAGTGTLGGGQLSLTSGQSSNGSGGAIYITAGYSGNGAGAPVNITGGQGSQEGGLVSIIGGYGIGNNAQGVYIYGGQSSLGLPGYGNVRIASGATEWKFDNTGNLVLPGNTFSVNYANGTQVQLGGGGGGGLPLANGNSNFNIATIDGNATIQSNNATFTFGVDGILTLPGMAVGNVFGSEVVLTQGTPLGVVSEGNGVSTIIQWIDSIFSSTNISRITLNDNLGNTGNIKFEVGTAGTPYSWILQSDGNTVLPGSGIIGNPANSSQDPLNPNVSTLVFRPDANYIQELVIDPTGPGHIHLRTNTSGNIDEPAANIFLGGENTAFEITSGSNNVALIHSGGNTWTFDTTGNTILPGSKTITVPPATGGAAGYDISITAGNADQTDYYTTAGGNINITAGLGAFNDGGGGGPGGNINITSGNSADPAGHAGDININAGTKNWTYDYTGNLILPNINGQQKRIKGTVETIYGDPWPSNASSSPTLVWTASSDIVVGAKLTVRVQQTNNNNLEMFDVLIAKEYPTGNVSYNVSNRLKTNDAIADTTVTVDLDGSNQLTLTLTTENSCYVSYSVTEFNNTFD